MSAFQIIFANIQECIAEFIWSKNLNVKFYQVSYRNWLLGKIKITKAVWNTSVTHTLECDHFYIFSFVFKGKIQTPKGEINMIKCSTRK